MVDLVPLLGGGWPTLDYLCFTAEQANSTVSMFKRTTSAPTPNLETSYDKKTWVPFTIGSTTITLANIGDKVYFRGSNSTFASDSSGNHDNFAVTGKVAASGNIMSIVDPTCSSLTIPGNNCFFGLFKECWDLTQAPKFPATVLTPYCYAGFIQYTGITSIELPCETLQSNCLIYAFAGCSNLTTIKVGWSSWNPSGATTHWVEDIPSSGTFICPVGLAQTRGIDYIPSGWTIQTY